MRRGPDRGTIYRLEDDNIFIGRGNKNTIVIRDNEVSREHIMLVRTEKGYELHDLGSSNSTFINGMKVEDVWLLESQCIIELGDSVTLEFRPDDPRGDAHTQAAAPKPATETDLSYLVVLRTGSQKEPAVYPLDSVTMTIGRSTECDIVVVEPEMSREHFRISLSGGNYYIEDLNSTNGTTVNGEKLTDVLRLRPNDMIQIGELIQFQFTDSPEKFASEIPTDILASLDTTVPKRTTSQASIPSILRDLPDPIEPGIRMNGHDLHNEVMVAYARSDWDRIVGPMVDALYQDDIRVWVDQYLVEESEEWLRATEQARSECWLLVVVISPDAMDSDLVKTAWRHFHNREKPILLMIYRPVENLPFGARALSRIQYNPGLPDVAFQQLVHEIKRLRE
jgi:pSer/pThr/pTyr-binding forkhead associated (FHA) protein